MTVLILRGVLLLALQALLVSSVRTPRFHVARPVVDLQRHLDRIDTIDGNQSMVLDKSGRFGAAEGFFEQKLDHFDAKNSQTFNQRYFYNFRHYIRGSKVAFLMLGGPGAESFEWVKNENTPFMKWARERGAAVFNLEHRFYGQSQPTPNQSVKNLQFLNSRQAVEDIAYFIQGMNRIHKLDDVKWITFGGGYAGALSLWARAKYPQLILGAVGSSPTLQLEVDAYRLADGMEEALVDFDKECAKNIRTAFEQLIDEMTTIEGREEVSGHFNLDPPFTSDPSPSYEDIQFFYATMLDDFRELVYFDDHDNNKAYLCDYMNNVMYDPFTILGFINDAVQSFKGHRRPNLDYTPTPNNYTAMINYLKREEFFHERFEDSAARSWMWQSCTELGLFPTTDGGPSSIFAIPLPMSYYINICRNVFGEEFNVDYVHNAVRSTLLHYGGTGTCADMFPESPDDPADLKAARQLVSQNIDIWLSDAPSPYRSARDVKPVRVEPKLNHPLEGLKGALKPDRKPSAKIPEKPTKYRKVHLARPPDGFRPAPEMRYFKNEQWAKPGGPFFLMIGGESAESPAWVLAENLTYLTWAKKLGATVYLLEHRYYGNSVIYPAGGGRIRDADLSHLTSLQMLYDVANFIQTVNADRGRQEKWITFGGSYSGALSVWMRALFPTLVVGAVGSSAPIEAKFDFYDYLRVVEDAIRSHSEECADTIAEGFEQMHNYVQTREGRQLLSFVFTLNPPWDDVSDVSETDIQYFFANIIGQFQGAVQYSGDNMGGYASGYGIPDMCRIMTQKGNDAIGKIAEFNQYMSVFYQGGGEFTFTDNSYDNFITYLRETMLFSGDMASAVLWTWQTCNEFGYFQTTDTGKTFFGSPVPLSFYSKMCVDAFGGRQSRAPSIAEEIQERIARVNRQYGGSDRYLGTNVVLPNGSIDPWHALGKNTSSDPTIVPIYIRGTAHCADMYPARSEDPGELTKARQLIYQKIQEWLHDAPEGNLPSGDSATNLTSAANSSQWPASLLLPDQKPVSVASSASPIDLAIFVQFFVVVAFLSSLQNLLG
ncbi:hypothetical protein Q1695_010489 [Nippostrongylus brasiliensis]|nr:hypothetical protein Q1695_010489 [Nippostrongylus brasiliensis]